MLEELRSVREEARSSLEEVQDSQELEAWHKRYLGKKGALTQMLRSVGDLPREERPAFGRAANEPKQAQERAYQARSESLER